MHDHLELYVAESRRSGSLSTAGFVSILVHALLIAWFVRGYAPAVTAKKDVPIARYVELIKQNPREFVEAPGPKVEKAPITAPLSDANRKASIPEPTGDRPTAMPGDGRRIYTPPAGSRGAQQPQVQAQQGQRAEMPGARSDEMPPATDTSRLTFQQPSSQASAGAGVDWRNAIREVGKVASLGGAGEFDLGQIGGGEKGFAEQGPLSFETQWYDWGEYAQSMVSKIRVHWYANMPQIIRTGMKGVVTIRFTIQRSGQITDIQTISGSGVPPYDFAARKAIESASPLNPLPKDFPNPSERVTAMFFYNMDPHAR